MSDSLFNAISDKLEGQRDKVALRLSETVQLTFGELLDGTARLAAELAQRGVGADDRLLVQVDKSVANVLLYLATLRLGAIYVPINTAYTRTEVAYFLEDADPKLFIVDDAGAYQGLDALASGARCSLVALGQWHADRTGAAATLMAASSRRGSTAPIAFRKAEDIAAIVYTSGTTGRSKGAMLSHGNLHCNARSLLELWGWRDDDVLLHALPIFHVHGLFVALHCALLGGSTTIFRPGFDAEDVCRWLPESTVLMGVPTFYTRLLALDGFDRKRCAQMRLFISGSAPLTEQTFTAFEARTGHRILERYGMSETLMNTSNPLDGERIAGTVGYPLPGVEARVVDDSGKPVEPGEVGMIEVRGPNVFSGYWRMPEKTATEFRSDGFFVTGDLGTQVADGRIAIVGRGKDLVISGGYNVYPKEVERLLDELPQISESAVFGVPHPDFGEAVVAVVVPATPGTTVDEGAVRSALQETLARYKQPKRVISVAELPRNAMGKVQKNTLREAHKLLFSG